MSAFTQNFQLEFLAPGEPIRNTRAVLERMAKSVDAALTRGGVAPPEAQDLVTEIAARQAADTAITARLDKIEGRTIARAQSTAGTYTATTAYSTPPAFAAGFTLTAPAGAWVQLGVSYAAVNEAGDLRIDFGTYKAGALVNYVSGTGADGHGLIGLGSIGGRYETNAGTAPPYQVQAADVDADGQVNLRLLLKASAGTRTVFAVPSDPLVAWARVL